jgi:hypothetical protein
MAITEQTALYEVLVRFDKDGTLAGAHQQRRTIVTFDDGSTTERLLPPESIDIAGLAASGVMQEVTSQALAQNAKLTADATVLANGYNELTEHLTAALNDLSAVSAAKDAMEGALASAQQQVAALQAQLAALSPPPDAPEAETPPEESAS